MQWVERPQKEAVSWMPTRYAADKDASGEIARIARVQTLRSAVQRAETPATRAKVRHAMADLDARWRLNFVTDTLIFNIKMYFYFLFNFDSIFSFFNIFISQ